MDGYRQFFILKTGSTIPALARRRGDFEDWIIAGLGLERLNGAVQIVNVEAGEHLLTGYAQVGGIVVTGSHAMVTQHHPWSEASAAWLAGAVAQRIPTLGICYGHQLLAHALGGQVGDNPLGIEVGTEQIRLLPAAAQDPLFAGLPDPLPAHVAHLQAVLALPPGAVPLAEGRRARHQAFVVGGCAWGVQFHPEFDAEVTRAYLEYDRPDLERERQDLAALDRQVQETPAAASLLRRFAAYVHRQDRK